MTDDDDDEPIESNKTRKRDAHAPHALGVTDWWAALLFRTDPCLLPPLYIKSHAFVVVLLLAFPAIGWVVEGGVISSSQQGINQPR